METKKITTIEYSATVEEIKQALGIKGKIITFGFDESSEKMSITIRPDTFEISDVKSLTRLERKPSEQTDVVNDFGTLGKRLKGKVKVIYADKGFCFVTSEGNDYFCHFSESEDELMEGDTIAFTVGQRGVKKNYALDVEILDKVGGF